VQPGLSNLQQIKTLLNSPISAFEARAANLLKKLSIDTALDLLFHLPSGILYRHKAERVSNLKAGDYNTICLHIDEYAQPRWGKRGAQPFRIYCSDKDGDLLTLVFFNIRMQYIESQFPLNQMRAISGRAEKYKGKVQIVHPDKSASVHLLDKLCGVDVLYPLTAGLSNGAIQRCIAQLLGQLGCIWDLEDWFDGKILKEYGLSGWYESLLAVHTPKSEQDLDISDSRARLRLALDELVDRDKKVEQNRLQRQGASGAVIPPSTILRRDFFQTRPDLVLTQGQTEALKDIDQDLCAPCPALRLIQGDVGCGKTLVAFLAMLSAVEAEYQCALLAPTEVLAKQHFETIVNLCGFGGLTIALLTASNNGGAVYAKIKDGITNIVVGTHAMLEEKVVFKKLGLVVIDEQHRFGVDQRESLQKKNEQANVIYLSATPIPRTLLMVYDGSVDISEIHDKPKDRLSIKTSVLPLDKLQPLIDRIRELLASGDQVYWVCPLVEESEKLDLAAAKSRFEYLQTQLSGFNVGLIHGKQKGKDQTMLGFKNGGIRLLVSTTVIEVGIDIPNASLIVIEHAERFGLAQLHQLRGRVGRGNKQSHCVLLYQPPLSDIAHRRLKIIQKNNDGFAIAEEDLHIRRGGDVLGIKQSGIPEFKTCSLKEACSLAKLVRSISHQAKDNPILN
jgi:ATP-dependent DNA helicase RecG